MKTGVTVILALFCALFVAGSRFEETEGQNVTIFFNIKEVAKADEVRITFKDHKEKWVIAQNPWTFKETPPAGVSLLVERGGVSVTILHVNVSRSGLYEAQTFFGNNVFTVNATLVVNKAPFSSSAAPPHFSTSKPLNSDLHWLWFIFAIVILGVIFVVLYFWNDRRSKCESGADEEAIETCLQIQSLQRKELETQLQ